MATSLAWIDKEFPSAVGLHDKKSDATIRYNCIAFAAGDDTRWWSHEPGYKWPATRSPQISSLIEVFTSLGYEPCSSPALEAGYIKVALYHENNLWKHAARQIESGKWVSKMGGREDIEHDNPECLCGQKYGIIHCIMRKAKQ